MIRALVALPLLLVSLLLVEAVGIWRYPRNPVAACPVDTVLVMGAAQYDGVPSPALQRRLDRALELYREGCADRIVVSGGKQDGDRFTEGAAGVRYLEARGVPSEALVPETRAATSYENLQFSASLLEGAPVLIVTDDLHAYRTQWLADHLGIEARVVPVATRGDRAGYALRELVILTAYQFGVLR